MTHIITYVTEESILLASDTRVSHIDLNKDKKEWFGDFGRKTFIIEQHNIGISFFGIGYVYDNITNQLHPLAHFLPSILNNINIKDSTDIKIEKIIESIRKIDVWDECEKDVFLSAFIAGYQKENACFYFLNTCHNNFCKIEKLESGQYIQKSDKEIKVQEGSRKRNEAISLIEEIMKNENIKNPNEIGGPTDILEIFPNGNGKWAKGPLVKEQEEIFYATSPDQLNSILKTSKEKYNLSMHK